MAKFSFEDTRYHKLWDSMEGRQLISYILSNPEMIREEPTFWKQDFEVDMYVTPSPASGSASFTATAKEPTKSNMAHWRAPLGDTIVKEQGEEVKYTGSIIDLITDGFREQAMEREHRMNLVSQFGSDTYVIADWVTNVVADGIKSINYSLSNMAAQALSKGSVYYKGGQGIHGFVYKAAIPEENFLNAGEKTWLDPDCEILTQMAAIEKKMKEDVWGKDFNLQWEIPYDTFHNIVLKNNQVIEWAKQNLYLAGRPILDNMIVQEADALRYISQFEGVSPIKVVSEKQYDNGAIVNGWDANKVVLRPTGYAGKVVHTDNLDRIMYEKYGNDNVKKVFSTTLDGLVTVCNTTKSNGDFKEWHTDIMAAAVPVLTDFLYHVIVDITKAD